MMANARLPAGVQLVEGERRRSVFSRCLFRFPEHGYALRHIGDVSAAFSEFHRCSARRRLCLLEITKPERLEPGAAQGYMRLRDTGARPPHRRQRRNRQVVAAITGDTVGCLRVAREGDRYGWSPRVC